MPRIPIQYAQGQLTNQVTGVTVDPGMAALPAEVKAKATDRIFQEYEQLQEANDKIYNIKAIADAQNEAMDLYMNMELNAGENPVDFAKNFNKELDARLNPYLEKAPSEKAKAMLFESMSGIRRELLSRSAYFEHRTRRTYMEQQAKEALKSQRELIRKTGRVGRSFEDIDDIVESLRAPDEGDDVVETRKNQLKKDMAFGVVRDSIVDDKPEAGAAVISNDKYRKLLDSKQVDTLTRMSAAKQYQKNIMKSAGLEGQDFAESVKKYKELFAND